jgi:hypothetical protein
VREGGEEVLAESNDISASGRRGARQAMIDGASLLASEGAGVIASRRASTAEMHITVLQQGSGASEREL